MTPTAAYEPSGSWDSIHVFETAERGRQAHYKLTSTVMLQLVTRKGSDNETEERGNNGSKGGAGWKHEGEVSLSGSMTRQVRFDFYFRLPLVHILFNGTDGTRLAHSRFLVSHHQYRAND
jgi:capping protein beta